MRISVKHINGVFFIWRTRDFVNCNKSLKLIKKLTVQLENVDRINKNLTNINKKLKDAKTEDEKNLLSNFKVV